MIQQMFSERLFGRLLKKEKKHYAYRDTMHRDLFHQVYQGDEFRMRYLAWKKYMHSRKGNSDIWEADSVQLMMIADKILEQNRVSFEAGWGDSMTNGGAHRDGEATVFGTVKHVGGI